MADGFKDGKGRKANGVCSHEGRGSLKQRHCWYTCRSALVAHKA